MESEPQVTVARFDDAGRQEFLRQSLEQFEAPLVRYAFSLTGDLETARDVVQDTFLRLCEQSPDAVDGHLGPWLFTVCRNRAHDVQRKAHRMTPLSEIELDHQPAPGLSPDAAAVASDAADHVEGLLADLPRNQREVVRLKFQHQLSYQEIAAVTSLSVGNVGFLLHSALKTLRTRLEKLDRSSPIPTV
ncbi:MAG TPA: sigma-70 family RNA polymerase sigma factor [Verrucomicrobiota bacterium]|nr:sigma-70 family RNA polymerase sigma factor [Verrucomicrobiales bacterium]HRI14651.1 sigma-70 family RNA polymerase sigma factor [Verrucomicrobiota bacterium]